MASLTLGPAGRNPDYGRGENNYAHIIGAQTAVLARGHGHLHSVRVGVVGTLAKFYDIAPGGTPGAGNQIATVSLAAVSTNGEIGLGDVAFELGCTVVVTGDASTELSVAYQGKNGSTVSPLTFP